MPRKKPIPPLTREEWLKRYNGSSEQATKWFYLGVGGFAVLILAMWLAGIYVQMTALSQKRTEENDLIQKTKASWEEIFASRDKKAAEENIKTALDQTLAQLKNTPAAIETTTTVTTSTAILTTTSSTSSTIK